jgi:hypothetical protein
MGAPDSLRVRSRTALLIAILILLHLIPLWAFKYFPSQDGPAHLNIATVLREYSSPNWPVFREYYLLNLYPFPNWFIYATLASLFYFVPPLVAEKLLLSAYFILLPLSSVYALRAIQAKAGWLCILLIPFGGNYLLHLGFYNFCYSLPVFFFFIGYWLRTREGFTFGGIVVLALLSLTLYFCHLVSLTMAYVMVVVMTLLQLWNDLMLRREMPASGVLRRFLRTQLLPLFYAFLPTVVVVVWFLLKQSDYRFQHWSSWTLLKQFISLEALVSYHPFEKWCATALVGLFVLITCAIFTEKMTHRRIEYWDGFLLVTLVYIIIYFLAPDGLAGGGYVNVRLSLYPFFGLVLWFGAQSYTEIWRRRTLLAAAAVVLLFLGLHTAKYAELNDYLNEYLSGAPMIESNTTLLPVSFTNYGYTTNRESLSGKIAVFAHAAGLIAAQRHAVDLTNFQITNSYFPIIFRPHLNPYVHLAAAPHMLGTEPPLMDFLAYQRAGGRVDYVLLWWIDPVVAAMNDTKAIFVQLAAHYDLIYTSPQRGLVQLYRRKNWEKMTRPN